MKQKIRILIADDDKYFRIALKDQVSVYGICEEAESELQAIEKIQNNHYDLAIIDMDIDGEKSGLNILKKTKLLPTHSIILSSQNDERIIEEAYIAGCDHFLAKLHYKKYLEPYIYKFINNIQGKETSSLFNSKFITHDEQLKEQILNICEMNLKNKTVFISGETGVGKSLVAEVLHSQTYDNTKPFVHLNCSEISENLIESELFGHEKGAFTGAINKKIGKLELANGGTLFLDEIATMPITMQQKLLKALDTHSFYPVGSNKEIKSEFTLITATCEDLFEKIHKNEFRKDLFFRVSGINLDIKPLRERVDDIPLLIRHFINSSARKIIIKDQAIEQLKQRPWTGNIRELKRKIELLSTNKHGIIENILEAESQTFLNENEQNQLLTRSQQDFIKSFGLKKFIQEIEQLSLKDSLSRNQGKITHTIKELQISTSAFYRIFENLKI